MFSSFSTENRTFWFFSHPCSGAVCFRACGASRRAGRAHGASLAGTRFASPGHTKPVCFLQTALAAGCVLKKSHPRKRISAISNWPSVLCSSRFVFPFLLKRQCKESESWREKNKSTGSCLEISNNLQCGIFFILLSLWLREVEKRHLKAYDSVACRSFTNWFRCSIQSRDLIQGNEIKWLKIILYWFLWREIHTCRIKLWLW